MTETDEQKATRILHDNKKQKQKTYFDKRHRAKERVMERGDQVLVKQNKSTTKTPFDPNPWTVTSTDGNRVHMKREGDERRVRDKNQLKKLKKRPPHLIPSWMNRKSNATTDHSKFDIECKLNQQQETNNQNQEQDVEFIDVEPETGQEHPNNPALEDTNDEAVLAEPHVPPASSMISEEMKNRLQLMIQAAEVHAAEAPSESEENPALNFHRTTRSEGHQYRWNPEMNEGPALIEVAEETGGNSCRGDAGEEERRDAVGEEERRDAAGEEERRDAAGEEERRDAAGEEERRDAAGKE